jgi:hypothetical protein
MELYIRRPMVLSLMLGLNFPVAGGYCLQCYGHGNGEGEDYR